MGKISKEAALFDDKIVKLSIQEAIYFNKEGKPTDTVHLALTNFSKKPKKGEVLRLQGWLKERIGSDSVRVVVE